MTDYVRRLVSGNKARFKDGKLDLDLDLVYVTDQVIIMGYPASGMEGLYRNRREDTKKFLESRHGKNYWIFNFCPIAENAYDAAFFDGRVSRYPFPDHHAPPLAILPLVAREMRLWLSGSPERVAVLHCKAGKGRSGTMACTYLLSLDDTPSPPQLERSFAAKEWATRRADVVMEQIPQEDDAPRTSGERVLPDEQPVADSPAQLTPSSTINGSQKPRTTLKNVLELHTSRRMKPSSDGKKVKQGVSIPSQRRWLHYWSLLLAHEAPSHVWGGLSPLPAEPEKKRQVSRVRLTDVKMRMKEPSGVKMGFMRVANAVLDRAGLGKSGSLEAKAAGDNHVWISLARYDDEFVDVLERWEGQTRDEGGHLGIRKRRSEHMGSEELKELFKEDIWDSGKMVKSFARMGAFGEGAVTRSDDKEEVSYTFRPLSNSSWKHLKEEVKATDEAALSEGANVPDSETNSIQDVTAGANEHGVVLDAAREVRVKLYMGQLFMGWFWFVPTFHMVQPPSDAHPKSVLHLTRKDVDFPLGLGSNILDLEVSMEWLNDKDEEGVQPPARVDSEDAMKAEPSGAAATLQALAGGDIHDIAHAKQAIED